MGSGWGRGLVFGERMDPGREWSVESEARAEERCGRRRPAAHLPQNVEVREGSQRRCEETVDDTERSGDAQHLPEGGDGAEGEDRWRMAVEDRSARLPRERRPTDHAEGREEEERAHEAAEQVGGEQREVGEHGGESAHAMRTQARHTPPEPPIAAGPTPHRQRALAGGRRSTVTATLRRPSRVNVSVFLLTI